MAWTRPSRWGPCAIEAKKQRVVRYIEKGVREGAKLVLDGRNFKLVGDYPDRCLPRSDGLCAMCTPEMAIAREEIFGPVAAILKAAAWTRPSR